MANLSPSRLRGTRAPRGRGDFDELCRWIAMQQATPAYTEDRQDDRSDVASTPQCQPATCRAGVSRPMALPIGHEARPISPSAASTLQFGRWHAGIKAANSCILMMSENESETSIHAQPLSSTATQSVCSAARSRRRVSHGRAERGPLAGACAHPPTAAPRPRAAVAGGAARLPAAAWCATVCLTRNCTRDAACPTPLCMPPPSLGVRGAPLDPSRGLASRLRWCAAAAATAVEIRADALTLALLAAPGADVMVRSPPGWIKCHCGPLVMPSAGDSHPKMFAPGRRRPREPLCARRSSPRAALRVRDARALRWLTPDTHGPPCADDGPGARGDEPALCARVPQPGTRAATGVLQAGSLSGRYGAASACRRGKLHWQWCGVTRTWLCGRAPGRDCDRCLAWLPPTSAGGWVVLVSRAVGSRARLASKGAAALWLRHFGCLARAIALLLRRGLWFCNYCHIMSADIFGRCAPQMRDKCFEKCITRPGNSMSSGETSCVQRCFDRYEDATKAVAKGLSG